jgi:hypothetical protein
MRSLLVVIALAACASNASRPLAAVDDYVGALRSGDFGKAYDLMSEKYKRDHTREEFVRLLKESPGEVNQTILKLTSSNRRVDVEARFVYDDLRDELDLVAEDGGWRIAGNPLDFYPQDTPQHALRSFLRAVETKRYDVVLRFVPDAYKDKQMTTDKIKEQFEGDKKEEIDQMIRLLTANLENPIEQNGDSARMPYGAHSEVKFKLEDGVWKIDDPD